MKTNPSILRRASVLFAGMIIVYASATANAQPINPATGLPMSDTPNLPSIDPATGMPVLKSGDSNPVAAATLASKTAFEVHELIANGQYDDALQRCLSFQRQLKGNQTLTPLLADWIELGRRFPKAREALIEIRDHEVREFSEVSAINGLLNQDDATYALFKSIGQQDRKLAQECYGGIAPLLIQRGEFDLCLSYLGDPQAQFDASRQAYARQLDNTRRLAEMNQRTARQMAEVNQKLGHTNPWTPPDISDRLKQNAENDFIGQTRQLIEILVGANRKAEAEKIREQAVTVLDDARLKSAVSDAEQKMATRAGKQ